MILLVLFSIVDCDCETVVELMDWEVVCEVVCASPLALPSPSFWFSSDIISNCDFISGLNADKASSIVEDKPVKDGIDDKSGKFVG